MKRKGTTMRGRNTMVRAGILSIVVAGMASGCGSTVTKPLDPDVPLTYGYVSHQLPPPPPYNRLAWVRAPSPLPSRELPPSAGGLITPVMELRLKSATLETAAKSLAAAGGYHSYVASSAASHRVTIHALGTLDELAASIAGMTGTEVHVDHESRAITFLPIRAESPEFYGSNEQSFSEGSQDSRNKVIDDEYQSTDEIPSS